MTDAEMVACFDLEYGPDGYPKMPAGRGTRDGKTVYQRFTDFCRTEYCVTDPKIVRQLWEADKAKMKARAAESHAKALATQARILEAEKKKAIAKAQQRAADAQARNEAAKRKKR